MLGRCGLQIKPRQGWVLPRGLQSCRGGCKGGRTREKLFLLKTLEEQGRAVWWRVRVTNGVLQDDCMLA